MIAALFVREKNHYSVDGVDCYDQKRNALTWRGGCPGIFHPPCRAWGQLSGFAKPLHGERELSVWAMAQVRKNGGVLEHPFGSRLWAETGCGSFGVRDRFGGLLIPVFQSWWGHRAPKKSCLYVVGTSPVLPEYVDPVMTVSIENMCTAERERTPQRLATWLMETARACS